MMKRKHGWIWLTAWEAIYEQKTTKAMKPSPRSLFQTIDRLFNETYMCRKMRINKARRLSHVNFFRKETMKGCILNINLKNIPVIGNINGSNKTNNGRANNRSKGVMKVNTYFLMIAYNNQSCFVMFQWPVIIVFYPKNPFTRHQIVSICWWYKLLGFLRN